jgi:hypothetical protein
MERQRRLLPLLAALAGLTWMAAVLLVAANPKGISLAGDLAYDRANRFHTLALVLLLATVAVTNRTIRAAGLPGRRATTALVVATVLMFAGNTVAFWGALVIGQQSEQFWGGLVGWLIYLPGQLLLLGAFIALARATQPWPNVTRTQRWSIGLVGVLLTITTATWAISPAATLAPALLATFALLSTGTAVSHATEAARSAVTPPKGPAQSIEPTG